MLYCLVNQQPGMAGRLYKRLSNADYSNLKFFIFDTKQKGVKCIKFTFDKGKIPLSPRAEKALLDISGCHELLYKNPIESSPAPTVDTRILRSEDKDKLKRIVADVIHNNRSAITVAKKLMSKVHEKVLPTYFYEYGYLLGQAEFEREYSYGKPFDLQLLIKRSLSSALSGYGNIEYTEDSILINNNLLCISHGISNCDISRGFISGFVNSNQKTKNTSVISCKCISRGEDNCSFRLIKATGE